MPASVGASADDRYTRKDGYYSRALRALAQRINQLIEW
jgi:hypothetical protein